MADSSAGSISSADAPPQVVVADAGVLAPAATLLPPLVLVLMAAVVVGGSVVGWNPLWPAIDYTVPEAVYLGDRAGVLELVGRGASLAAAAPVRAGFLRSEEVRLTPLEAAIATRELYMVNFVVGLLGEVPDDELRAAVCLANAVGADEIRASLLAGRAMPDCGGVTLPWSNES